MSKAQLFVSMLANGWWMLVGQREEEKANSGSEKKKDKPHSPPCLLRFTIGKKGFLVLDGLQSTDNLKRCPFEVKWGEGLKTQPINPGAPKSISKM